MKRKVTKITKSNLNELRNELDHHLVSLTLGMEQEYLKRMSAYSEKIKISQSNL